MHGGPPSALLVTEALAQQPRPGTRPARVSIEILGPVPLLPLTVRSEVSRPGRSVEMLDAVLVAGDREVLKARIWRIRTDDTLDVPPPAPVPGPVLPVTAQHLAWFGQTELRGYSEAVEVRFMEGGWHVPGPATAWLRLRVPLVDGEAVSPIARLMAVVDSGNGISSSLDFDRWLFVNPDLVVHLVRDPVGEWICLEARTHLAADGLGLAESALFDQSGYLGRGAQSLFIDRRSS